MDAVSGIFLGALGADMTAMEEYFPFITAAFDIMQYTAWAVLFLITVWQLFRVFGGPITEAENPWQLVARSAIFALLIGYAKPIFMITLDIARAPYTALMDLTMTAEDFTFAGVEQVLTNGLVTLVSTITIVAPILVLILLIALGWNYFKLLLEAVERYIVVGVLCYTSPLAFAMGGSKATNQVFKSWCRMVGSQLLLLVLNVWFLRGFNSSVGQYIGNGGALSSGQGSIFLWLFCALAFLKTAQKFDSYLAAMGLNVAQTGSSMGMELLMAARVISGVGHGARSAGSVFRGGSTATGTGAAASGFAAGFASKFKGNSYVRDAVVDGGTRMGMGGSVGFVGRAFGGVAARNGATLTGESISSVAARPSGVSGTIAGDIADRSLGNYMPQLSGHSLKDTQITGGHISTTTTAPTERAAVWKCITLHSLKSPLRLTPWSRRRMAAPGIRWPAAKDAVRSMMRLSLPAARQKLRRWRLLSLAPPRGQHFARLGMALSRPAENLATASGTTAHITVNLMRPTPLCSPPTVWTGTPCSSRLRLLPLSRATPLQPITRRYSATSCPVTSSRSHRLTAAIVRRAISRSVMQMAQEQLFTTQPDIRRPAAIIRYTKTIVDSSGLPYTAIPLWSAGLSMKTASLSTMVRMSAQYRWNPFGISPRPAALGNRSSARISNRNRQSVRTNLMHTAMAGWKLSLRPSAVCELFRNIAAFCGLTYWR